MLTRVAAHLDVGGVWVPWLIYGTAWKQDRTAALTELALTTGFVGFDTANQRKHYVEAAVGEAIAAAGIPRDQLFVQTKFTYARGQDHRLPYDPSAPLTQQVQQSFASSLDHLGIDRLDSYLMHGPERLQGWSEADREVWRAMEGLHREGRVRLLGISGVSGEQLATLCTEAAVPPSFVQNRCYARTGWDREVRTACRGHGVTYQGFSLLTANARELASRGVSRIADRLGATIPQVIFSFAKALGIVALTGTSDQGHMQQDLAAGGIVLEPADVGAIERLAEQNRE